MAKKQIAEIEVEEYGDDSFATESTSTAVATPPSGQTTLATTQRNTSLSAPISAEVAAALEKSLFESIRPGSSMIEAFENNYAEGETFRVSNLTKVSIPTGGMTQWMIEELEGTKATPSITGAVVYYGAAGALWPSTELSEDTKPLLTTRDMTTAVKVGDDYGDLDPDEIEKHVMTYEDGSPKQDAQGRTLYDWNAITYCQCGSGKNSHGKRCKERRIVCLLRPDDVFPLLVNIASGSIGNLTSFFQKLKKAYYYCNVELTLKADVSNGGIKFSKVVPRLVNYLTPEEGERLKVVYKDMLTAAFQDSSNASSIDG
jgi:hypothetical protein